ncbi:MAG: hypothetical protein M3O82_05620 [Verrucomicrobiota bacterium]|nr:hypothetical protein [Verrucomicrobiota bacterium]
MTRFFVFDLLRFMKTLRRKPASIANTRWAAYAAAGAATALAGSNSAEATIHYSGLLNKHFPPGKDSAHRVPLDSAGDFLFFERLEDVSPFYPDALAACSIKHGRSAGVLANFYDTPYLTVNKLRFGDIVRNTRTYSGFYANVQRMAGPSTCGYSPWGDPGPGYIGFRFGNPVQYGWARVKMSGRPENGFVVVDYAYADPGENITAGQKSSNEVAPSESSLGWLAAGAVGLLAWRKSRSRTAS